MVLTAVLAVAAGAAGCSGSVPHDDLRNAGGVITGLTVSGDPGSAPTVRMRAPLRVAGTTSAVTVTGAGAPVQVDQLFVLELSLYDARTGKLALSTYDTGTAVAGKTTDDRLFPALRDALVGVRQGSRLVLVATAADAYASGGVRPRGVERSDDVVVVADVVAVPPTTVLRGIDGRPRGRQPGTPRLLATEGVPSAISFAGVRRPAGRQVLVLAAGTGPAIRAHSVISVDYLAQRSGEQDPFENTFFKEPEQIALGTGTAPPEWDTALVGVHRGSRVLIYGPDRGGMIAWVVDVLGVS